MRKYLFFGLVMGTVFAAQVHLALVHTYGQPEAYFADGSPGPKSPSNGTQLNGTSISDPQGDGGGSGSGTGQPFP